jgi:hypothetical protein
MKILAFYFLQILIFCASWILIQFEYAKIKKEWRGTRGKKGTKIWKVTPYVIILIFITSLGLSKNWFQTVILKEEFKKSLGNTSLVGTTENISLEPKLKINKPLDLAIKDTWIILAYDIYYELKPDNSLFINFIYKEDVEENRRLEEHGLWFSYESKFFIFNPVYIHYIFTHQDRGRLLKEYAIIRDNLSISIKRILSYYPAKWMVAKAQGVFTNFTKLGGLIRRFVMNETQIILATLAFIFGSVQYQIRIRLQDIKEDILRIMRYYTGRGEKGSLSLAEAINIMRDHLKKNNLEAKQKQEFRDCIEEYDNMQKWLKISGIYAPAFLLCMYLVFKVIL